MPAEAPSAPRFEHRSDPGAVLGIGTGTPRLSWTVPSADAGWRQVAYEIEIERGGDVLRFEERSGEQVLVPWPGDTLRSREAARVRVRVSDGATWTDWSAPGIVEAGLLSPVDWTGSFISPRGIGAHGSAAPTVIGRIDLGDGTGVVAARLYATALGIYTGLLNGTPVSDAVLAPGWTSYEHRLRYHAYDVTELIRPGINRLEFTLGNGWYRGRIGFEGRRAIYGDRLGMLAQLELTLADGTVRMLATDGTWRAVESTVVADDLYDGETRDLNRAVIAGGDEVGVESIEYPLDRLVAAEGPVTRQTGVQAPIRIWQSPSGKTLADFGQNLVGWVRLTVRGETSAQEIVVRHAEVIEHGELGTRPLRAAAATDRYLLADPGEVVLQPGFTLHGFRYAEVTGVPDLKPADVQAVVIGSDLERRGWFRTSDDLVNRFHENIVWSMRGNFVDIPTDCPQRDERLGWTGDIQVFAPTASFLFDSTAFLSSWLADLAAEQWPDGTVPYVVPDVLGREQPPSPAAGWGDAATVVPWALFERSGDRAILRRQYPSMRAWVDRISRAAGADRIWSAGFQFGDWLDPTAPPDDPAQARTDPALIATAHFAHSAQLLADAAHELGAAEDEVEYALLAGDVRTAFASRFATADGRLESDTPTAYALAIAWDLLPEPDQRAHAGQRLADLVRASGFRISTGFLGTPLICDALAKAGQARVAHRLLLQTECPSWLYPVTMGATTIWERWDSMLPDGTINPGEMTSFNHFALGAVGDWMQRSIGGLAPGAPGYRILEVAPVPPAALRFASTHHVTPYGAASVRWSRDGEHLELAVEVPVGATALVTVPGSMTSVTVGHGSHTWRVRDAAAPPAVCTVRDLVDDERAWSALLDATRSSGVAPQTEPRLAARLLAHFDAPVTELARALAPEGITTAAMRRKAAEIAEQVLAVANPVPDFFDAHVTRTNGNA